MVKPSFVTLNGCWLTGLLPSLHSKLPKACYRILILFKETSTQSTLSHQMNESSENNANEDSVADTAGELTKPHFSTSLSPAYLHCWSYKSPKLNFPAFFVATCSLVMQLYPMRQKQTVIGVNSSLSYFCLMLWTECLPSPKFLCWNIVWCY